MGIELPLHFFHFLSFIAWHPGIIVPLRAEPIPMHLLKGGLKLGHHIHLKIYADNCHINIYLLLPAKTRPTFSRLASLYKVQAFAFYFKSLCADKFSVGVCVFRAQLGDSASKCTNVCQVSGDNCSLHIVNNLTKT